MESWWALPAWLSSGTAMFLFFNVLVGAVAVMSRGQQGGHGRRLCRSASSMVIGRLRSFSSVLSFSDHPGAGWYYHTSTEAEELVADVSAPEPAAAEPACTHVRTAAANVAAPAAVAEARKDEAVEEEIMRASSDEPNVQGRQSHAPEPSPPAADVSAAAVAEQPPESVSNRRPRGCRRREAEEAAEGKAELNARADLFIQQFREDLKLQRLNSIINYTRVLRQRAGAALSTQHY